MKSPSATEDEVSRPKTETNPAMRQPVRLYNVGRRSGPRLRADTTTPDNEKPSRSCVGITMLFLAFVGCRVKKEMFPEVILTIISEMTTG